MWRDYDDSPLGTSDQWVSAFVAGALAHPGLFKVPNANATARRAARRLLVGRTFEAGFGFNERAGPDADSTAHALILQRRLGMPVEANDVRFLRAHFRANGGCATYLRADAWGVAHVDVTPVAFLALPKADCTELGGRVRRFSDLCREGDGGWPAYWWRGRDYSTYWNLRLMRTLVGPRHLPSEDARPRETAFEVAYALAASTVSGCTDNLLAQQLVELQGRDGSWSGAPNLRVTDPRCYRPWEASAGTYLTDNRSAVTTASALVALGTLLDTEQTWERT